MPFEKPSNSSKRLKEIMELRNLRQVDILRMCQPLCEQHNVKLSKSSLSQYVSGDSIPDQHKLTILGLALDVSEAWLMGYDVPMERVYSGGLTVSQVRNWVKQAASKEEKAEIMTAILQSSPIEDAKELLKTYLDILMK